jgi:hypothetical protein
LILLVVVINPTFLFVLYIGPSMNLSPNWLNLNFDLLLNFQWQSCSMLKNFCIIGLNQCRVGIKKKWKPDKVSNQFSIWKPLGITLSGALYET